LGNAAPRRSLFFAKETVMPDTLPEPKRPTEPGGEMEHNDPRHADDLDKAGDARAADEERTYDPSTVEANRSREQGNGLGEKELDAQRDPTAADSSEHFGQMKPEGGRGAGSTDVEHGGARRGGTEQA
jgi:hypothetical protein